MGDAELHAKLIDQVDALNSTIWELTQSGCDIRVQVKNVDEDLLSPKSNPQIVVRATRLLPHTTLPSGEIKQFVPKVIEKETP